jgi:HK97 gp10 family phage protein
MAKGTFEIKGLDAYLEELARAGQDADAAVADVLEEARPIAEANMQQRLRASSELWTGETAATIHVTPPQRDGNYTFIALEAGDADVPQAFYKEFGTTRQAAEPFWRPALTELRRTGLKRMMKQVLERMGVATA